MHSAHAKEIKHPSIAFKVALWLPVIQKKWEVITQSVVAALCSTWGIKE